MKPPLLPILLALLIALPASAADLIPLRAGPLTMMFDPENAFLRYIRLGPDEVLRGISAPVRNQFWGTVRPQVRDLKLDQRGDGFSLEFDVVCQENAIDFIWHGTLQGNADGQVEFTFDGRARSDFLRNRIGFCVLHGPSAAGRPWRIETSQGGRSEGGFPTSIAPHQPAKDLRALAHEFAPGRWASVRFEGDVFEMEDQRNWTDASFKTYCTPLALPYPAQVAKGTSIRQKITLRLEEGVPKTPPPPLPEGPVVLAIGPGGKVLPGIGLGMSSQAETLSARERRSLAALHLDHLRVDLTPANEDCAGQMRRASQLAAALGVRLIVGLHLGESPTGALERLAAEIDAVRPQVSHWLVIGANPKRFAAARDVLKPRTGTALIGVGEDTNFTELNRARPEEPGIEAVSYGLNPQVHAFDNLSMIETLAIQGDTVRSARQFTGARPLIISPVTLRVQRVDQAPPPGQLPSNVDPRQSSMFAGGWTLGSVKYLAEAGVEQITYFETAGWKGVLAAGRGLENGAAFPASPGQRFPVYHVLQAIGEFAGGVVQPVESTDAMAVVGLSIIQHNRRRMLVANLTDRQRSATLRGATGAMKLRRLGADPDAPGGAGRREGWSKASTWAAAPDAPIVLPPHGIVTLDESLR